jgi:putative FmdB family regulatory protein
MPLFEYECLSCGKATEMLVMGSSQEKPVCGTCGSTNMKKLLSAHSSMSGSMTNALPGLGDTGCCGSSPAEANCAGPGSC